MENMCDGRAITLSILVIGLGPGKHMTFFSFVYWTFSCMIEAIINNLGLPADNICSTASSTAGVSG